MNIADIIIIAVIATLFVLAIVKRIRDKKKGKGCCGGASCTCCTKNNQSCNSNEEKHENS